MVLVEAVLSIIMLVLESFIGTLASILVGLAELFRL